jgi:hypothetical protein
MQTVKPGMRLGLVLHPSRDPTPVVGKITSWARSHGKQVIVAARVPDDVETVSEAQLADEAEALISLGGDGTMLGALRLAAQRPVPILGVNLGSLGFLVEVEPHELDTALDRLAMGDFTIEEHSAAVLTDEGDESIAFNDIALASVPGEGAVQASLRVRGRPSGRYRSACLISPSCLKRCATCCLAAIPARWRTRSFSRRPRVSTGATGQPTRDGVLASRVNDQHRLTSQRHCVSVTADEHDRSGGGGDGCGDRRHRAR